MGFSASNADQGGGAPQPANRQEPPSNAQAGSQQRQADKHGSSKEDNYRTLLDLVLKQTLLAEDAEARDRLESIDGLIAVARRRKDEPFSVDPIGIELVQTVLQTPFRALVASEEKWLAMTEQVARTLFDDPASYERLSNLWRRLSERCRNGN